MAERIKLPVAVHLFLIKDGNILLLRRYNTGYEDGKYSVIAGHIDGNEHVYNAMIREAKEEAGIHILEKDLKIVQVMHRKKETEERIDYFFICNRWEGEIKIMEPDKCDELEWYSLEGLPENMVDYVNAAIRNYEDEISFSIYGW
jgi:ADP-ribose pyrophosphatase YjhB (NUDIX family)